MLDIHARPNFDRFLDTLLLRRAYRRPPLFDFHVDAAHKSRVIGRTCASPADDVEFWMRAGYDYVQCPLYIPMAELNARLLDTKGGNASHSSEIGLISSLDDFRSRSWSWQPLAAGDLRPVEPHLDRLRQTADALPDGMKAVLHLADVFTYAWELIGFTPFCVASIEQPAFVSEVMSSLSAALLNLARAGVDILGDRLGALFYSDDIAYTEGLMLSPGFFAEYLFPTIRTLGELGASCGAPLIYHTDGRLYDVFDHFIAIGVKGVQPLEPKSMDPLLIKQRWPRRFCLMGNIDLDLMSRGTLDQAEAHIRDRIDKLHFGLDAASPYPGGYMPGISNTVPYYVNFENYRRMLEIVHHLDPAGCELL